MSENKRLIKNTGLIAIGSFGAKVASFLLLPLYTSILSTEDYGTYDLIVAVGAFLLPVVTLSMNEAMFRFIIDSDGEETKFKRIVSQSFVLQMIGVLALGIIMLIVSRFYNPMNCLYIWLYVFSYAMFAFAAYMLRGLGKVKNYTVVSLAKNILQLSINVLVIAVFRWGLQGLLVSLCISEWVAFIFVFISHKLWRYIKISNFSPAHLKEMLNYSLPLIPNTLCAQIINLSDRMVISAFLGTAANGIYSISYKFPNMIETVYHYFYLAWSESASRVFAKGKEAATKYYQTLHDTLDNLVYAVVICLIAGMAIMFRIFVRGDYVQGYAYIPLLTLAMYFNCMCKFYSGIYTALKKTKILATSTAIGALFNIVINVALINTIGLYAAALSTLVSEIIVIILRHRNLKRDVDIKISILGSALKVLIAVIVVGLYSYDNWWKIGISLLIAVTYSVVINRKAISQIAKKVRSKVMKRQA